MVYVRKILTAIEDDKPLRTYQDDRGLMNLVHGYNGKAIFEKHLNIVSMDTTGKEFKDLFEQLPVVDKINILYGYTKYLKSDAIMSEDPEVRENRKLRHWLIKASFVISSLLLAMFMGGAVVIGVKTGSLPESPALDGVVSLAGEILKLIIGGAP